MTDDANLDSDEQGEKGQAQFRSICIDAKLTCNEAHRDRAGFDFVVNDRINADQKENLDGRHAPFSCLIQTKCIKSSNDQVRLRLSSLEQIAKDLKPSFIYIFRLNDDGIFCDSVLIHIVADVLEKILKKLRSEEAAGRFAVNHARMCLSMSNGIELEPTGQALRKYLAVACGDDPGKYATNKALALKSLGYEGAAFSVKMSLDLANPEEFVDVMLGLKSEVPAKILAQSEIRFGITLQREDLSNVAGALTVQPHSPVQGGFVIRRDRFSDPISLKGEIAMAPSPKDFKKVGGILFRNKLLTFVGKMLDDKFAINPNLLEIKEGTILFSKDWLQVFRIIQAVRQDGFSIAVEPPGLKRLYLDKMSALMSVEEDIVTFDVENAKRVVRLVEMAGAIDDAQISFKELCQQTDLISAGHALLSGQDVLTPLSFEIENNEQISSIPEIVDGIHINFFSCQDIIIAWLATVQLKKEVKGDLVKFVSSSINFEEIVKMTIDEYSIYVEQARVRAGTGIFLAREM